MATYNPMPQRQTLADVIASLDKQRNPQATPWADLMSPQKLNPMMFAANDEKKATGPVINQDENTQMYYMYLESKGLDEKTYPYDQWVKDGRPI